MPEEIFFSGVLTVGSLKGFETAPLDTTSIEWLRDKTSGQDPTDPRWQNDLMHAVQAGLFDQVTYLIKEFHVNPNASCYENICPIPLTTVAAHHSKQMHDLVKALSADWHAEPPHPKPHAGHG